MAKRAKKKGIMKRKNNMRGGQTDESGAKKKTNGREGEEVGETCKSILIRTGKTMAKSNKSSRGGDKRPQKDNPRRTGKEETTLQMVEVGDGSRRWQR